MDAYQEGPGYLRSVSQIALARDEQGPIGAKSWTEGKREVTRNAGAALANACLRIMSRAVWLERTILLFNEPLIPSCIRQRSCYFSKCGNYYCYI